MRRAPLALVIAVLACAAPAALPGAAHAVAAPPTVVISGKLAGRPGTVVLAVGLNSAAKGVRLDAAGAFSLRIPKSTAKDTSLQLVAPNGRYAGPVVLGTNPKRAYINLGGATVNLGALTQRDGYASLAKALPKGAVDTARWATADGHGKPVGAGRLGVVRTGTAAHVTAAGVTVNGDAKDKDGQKYGPGAGAGAASRGGDDPDRDGIPSLFDADDNGNGTLDVVDPASAQSNAGLYSILSAPFASALNANAGDVTQEQIDGLLSGEQTFTLGFFYDAHYAGGRPVRSVDVDCFTLVYCAKNTGTAIMNGPGPDGEPVRWATYSPDGSGLPNLPNDRPSTWSVGVQPRVTTAQIHPGDAFTVNFRLTSGEVVTVPTSLSAYFVTTPAITHWSTSAASGDVTYPITDTSPSSGHLEAPDGRLSLTFWRPQRMAIPGTGESGFIDMGHLHWGVEIGVQGRNMEFGCGGYFSDYSASLHDDFQPGGKDDTVSLFPLHDASADAAPDATRTLSFAVDLAGCLRRAGVDPTDRDVNVRLAGATEGRPGGADRASQELSVHLP